MFADPNACVIVRLGDVEVRSSDPTAIRTVWRLLATCVSDDERDLLQDHVVVASPVESAR